MSEVLFVPGNKRRAKVKYTACMTQVGNTDSVFQTRAKEAASNKTQNYIIFKQMFNIIFSKNFTMILDKQRGRKLGLRHLKQ